MSKAETLPATENLPDEAAPQSIGLSAFQGTKTHFILQQHGLLGNLTGLKGMMLTMVEARRTSAVFGQLAEDIEEENKRRRYRDRLVDEFLAFLALQHRLAWELSMLAARLHNKIETLDEAIKGAHETGHHELERDLRDLRKEAKAQKDAVEKNAEKLGNIDELDELEEMKTETERETTLFERLATRIRQKRQVAEQFSNEAHVRPDTSIAEAQAATWDELYEEFTTAENKKKNKPKDDKDTEETEAPPPPPPPPSGDDSL